MELALLVAAPVAAGAVGLLIVRLRRAHELDSTRLRIQYAVARTLYESRSLDEAAPRLLESIGRPFGWELGGLWIVSPSHVLHSVASWHAKGVDPADYDKLNRRFVVKPGVGLPGRVWESGQPGWVADVVQDRDSPRAELASRAGLRGAVGFPIRTTEEVLGVIEFFTREFREPDADMLELMAALGSQVGEFIERQRAAEALHASEVRRERVQRLLAETGRVLGSLLEPEEVLERVARLLVPELADWCVVYLTRVEAIVPVAMVFDDPEKEELVRRELARYPTDPGRPAGLARVIREGEAELVPDMGDKVLREIARDEEHLDLMRQERIRSRILVPLTSRDRIFGALSLATSGSGRVFDEDDLRLAEEIGRRSGAALENARLYAERSQIATTLQESLLPPELPQIPGIDAAARFRPTGQVGAVGGDFYDLFQAGGERWAVTVGDVCGKGPDAAAVTALARYTLRAAAMREPSPSRTLAMLNEALLRQRSDQRFCTVAYAHVEPGAAGAHVTLACGGHPLPLVLRADGAVEWLGVHGTLLGVVPDPTLENSETELGPGDALILYTDGVSEARGPNGSLDEPALAALVASCSGLSAAAIAARVEAAALELQSGTPRDDIAVVVLQVSDGSGGSG